MCVEGGMHCTCSRRTRELNHVLCVCGMGGCNDFGRGKKGWTNVGKRGVGLLEKNTVQ